MITAKEALDLYNTSLYTLERYLLDNFHSGIRQSAMNGLRKYMHHMGAEEYDLPKLSILEEKAMVELEKLGYKVQYTFYGETYVPRGLADDYGDGTVHQNYGIIVTW